MQNKTGQNGIDASVDEKQHTHEKESEKESENQPVTREREKERAHQRLARRRERWRRTESERDGEHPAQQVERRTWSHDTDTNATQHRTRHVRDTRHYTGPGHTLARHGRPG
ncbi:hypothetical protein P5V15_012670 [Pogonomyrmex californicus]